MGKGWLDRWHDHRRLRGLERLTAFIASRPQGDLRFGVFTRVAGSQVRCSDVFDIVFAAVQRGGLVQFIRESETGTDYPDMLAVPNTIAGKPVLLEHLKVLYRFERP